MEWVDCNLGSKVTMKYPSCYLMGPGAHGEILSMAFAGKGQHQDAGGKMMHFAPNTSSKITSKSISKGGGRSSYRGLLKVYKGATNSSNPMLFVMHYYLTRKHAQILILILKLMNRMYQSVMKLRFLKLEKSNYFI